MHDYPHLRLHQFRTRRGAARRHTRPAASPSRGTDKADSLGTSGTTAPPVVIDLTEPPTTPVAPAGRTMRP